MAVPGSLAVKRKSSGVRRAMAAEGIASLGHVPQPVTRELMDGADTVLVMERRHRELLLGLFPDAAAKVETLTDADLDVFLARHRGDASVLFARPALSERAYPLGIGVHAGFTLVSPRLLDDIVHGAARDLDTALIGRYMPVSLKDARFLDIGTPERLAKAPEFLREIVR